MLPNLGGLSLRDARVPSPGALRVGVSSACQRCVSTAKAYKNFDDALNDLQVEPQRKRNWLEEAVPSVSGDGDRSPRVHAQAQSPAACAICLEQLSLPPANDPESYEVEALIENRELNRCNHIFHTTCLQEHVSKGGKRCPTCRTPIARDVLQRLGYVEPPPENDPAADTMGVEYVVEMRLLRARGPPEVQETTDALDRALQSNNWSEAKQAIQAGAHFEIVTQCYIWDLLFTYLEENQGTREAEEPFVTTFIEFPNVNVNRAFPFGQAARPLHLAALYENVDWVIQSLVNAGADVNAVDQRGSQAMHFAAYNSRSHNVAMLLELGGAQRANHRGATPLHKAMQVWSSELDQRRINEQVRTVEHLCAAGANVNARDNNGTTPVMYAANRGNDRILRLLVDRNADLTRQNYNGNTALHLALKMAESNEFYESTVSFLFERTGTTNLHQPNIEENTPLKLAEDNLRGDDFDKFLEVADSQLLDIPPNLTRAFVEAFQSNAIVSPLSPDASTDVATGITRWHMTRRLRGALKARSAIGARYTILGGAVMNKTIEWYVWFQLLQIMEAAADAVPSATHVSCLDTLLQREQFDVNHKYQQERNNSLLHLAASMPKLTVQVLQALLERGADVNAVNDQHQQAIHVAAFYWSFEAVVVLVQAGCKIEALATVVNVSGRTPLMAALAREVDGADTETSQHQTVLNILNGSSDSQAGDTKGVNTADEAGETPLMLAARNSRDSTVWLLLSRGAAPMAVNKNRETALHAAMLRTQLDSKVVSILMKPGRELLRMKNSDGKTALDVLKERRDYGTRAEAQDIEEMLASVMPA